MLSACALAVDRPASAATFTFQAENAEIVRGRKDISHAGFTGAGFVDYANEPGSYVEWVLDASQDAANQTLKLRYANGSSANRPMAIVVNNVAVSGSFAFGPTGSWDTWRAVTIPNQSLHRGLNTIRATSLDAGGGPNLDSLQIVSTATISARDWAQAVIYSTTQVRFPDPAQLSNGALGRQFRYNQALVMLGEYQTFLRNRSKFSAYLDYIRHWVDARTDETGTVTATDNPNLNFLDTIMGGRVALLLHAESGLSDLRYKRTADKLWDSLKTHQRTPAGDIPGRPDARIFWHSSKSTAANTVLLDGAYMSLPFEVLYSKQFPASLSGFPDVYRDVANQLIGDRYHLQDEPGTEVTPPSSTHLLYHAYDREGDGKTNGVDWTLASTKHSPVFWCRAMGWYAMTLIDVLEAIPNDGSHAADRAELVGIFQNLMAGLKAKQTSDGRWYTVVYSPPTVPVSDNFLETSCSAMFVYSMSKALVAGYIDASYAKVASKAYRGVLSQLTLQPVTIGGATQYLTSLKGTAAGQVVGGRPLINTRRRRTMPTIRSSPVPTR